MTSIRGTFADRLKAVLDRRYIRRDEIDLVEISALRKKVETLEQDIASCMERLEMATAGGDFVSGEDPHELRKRLFAAYRLANECAISVERLLQADLILRRDLDAISPVDANAEG
jgi:hypothetical protein